MNRSPESEAALVARCKTIEGLSLGQLAERMHVRVPQDPIARKGWSGLLIEQALGATAGGLALPDFHHLNIELKTIPLNATGKPTESTFVTSIPLLTIQQQTWKTSTCYSKLKRVLWLPVEGCSSIPFPQRRIGRAVLWSPNQEEEEILSTDWNLLSFMIGAGQLGLLDARIGQYLQVRPKAANANALCYGFDETGNKVSTMPRGFYLRSAFTSKIVAINL